MLKGYVPVRVGSGVPFDHSLEIFVIIIISMGHIMSCGLEERYLEFGQYIIASAMKTKKLYKFLFRRYVASCLLKCEV